MLPLLAGATICSESRDPTAMCRGWWGDGRGGGGGEILSAYESRRANPALIQSWLDRRRLRGSQDSRKETGRTTRGKKRRAGQGGRTAAGPVASRISIRLQLPFYPIVRFRGGSRTLILHVKAPDEWPRAAPWNL